MNSAAANMRSAWRIDHHINALARKAPSKPHPGGQWSVSATSGLDVATAARLMDAGAACLFGALRKSLCMEGLFIVSRPRKLCAPRRARRGSKPSLHGMRLMPARLRRSNEQNHFNSASSATSAIRAKPQRAKLRAHDPRPSRSRAQAPPKRLLTPRGQCARIRARVRAGA